VGVHMGFVVEKVTMGQVFFRVLWFFPVSVIPSWLSILIYHLGMNNRPDAGRSSETVSPHRHEQQHISCFCYSFLLDFNNFSMFIITTMFLCQLFLSFLHVCSLRHVYGFKLSSHGGGPRIGSARLFNC
jgi:magnesium-transporting ATPase (P-type)